MKTPIASAKRRKHPSSVPKISYGEKACSEAVEVVVSSTTTESCTTTESSSEGGNGIGSGGIDLTLSPLHNNIRPVVRGGVGPGDGDLVSSAAEDDGEDNDPDASWVGRKVDAIFSPVLSLLQWSTANNDGENNVEDDDASNNRGVINDQSQAGRESLANNNGHNGMPGTPTNSSIGHNATTTTEDVFSPMRTDTDSSSSGNHHHMVDVDVNDGDEYKGVDNNVAVDVGGAALDAPMAEEDNGDNRHDAVVTTAQDEKGEDTAVEEDDEDEFNPYLFIKCLPPYQYAVPPGWHSRPKALPPLVHPSSAVAITTPPICLVLDLDETLVHCTVDPVSDADMVFPVEFNDIEYQVHVRCRPYLVQFLEAVSSKFEVVIFTASQQVYADKLLDKIDPEGKFIRHRMFRDSCLPVEGNFLKDLSVLGRDLSKAVLVDNSPHAFGYQVDNGIPIESWFDDPNDKELLKLEMFLRTLHGVEDVRDVVRKTFQTRKLVLDA